jgi:hypothetical protein
MADIPIGALHLETGHGADERVAAAFVTAASRSLGLGDEASEHLGTATEAVALAIDERGFDDRTDAALDVRVLKRGHAIVVQIDDRGLPFNYEAEDAADAGVIGRATKAGWIDALVHTSLGRRGNRTELVRHLDAGAEIRHSADPLIHENAQQAAAAPSDERIEIRLARGADAEQICQLTWRTYGYSYQHDEYYQPERLRSILSGGQQKSWIAVNDSGEVVGHTAAIITAPGSKVVEHGRLMVDPRYRGHHLMGKLNSARSAWVARNGFLGAMADCVTVHTRTQIAENADMTGILLGFLPPAVDFRGIAAAEGSGRQAVVVRYEPIADHPPATVYVADDDLELAQTIYRRLGLRRRVIAGSIPRVAGPSVLNLELWRDRGVGQLHVKRAGADLGQQVHDRVRSLRMNGAAVVYATFPIVEARALATASTLADAGFCFGCVLPAFDSGHDVLRLQHVGDTAIDRSAIKLAGDFAPKVLDHILAQWAERG